MKPPALTASHALCQCPSGSVYASPSVFYRLNYCTTGLYASQRRPGHPVLKHCYLRIEDNAGAREYWSLGRGGLALEPNPHIPTTHCSSAPMTVSHAQKSALLSALAGAADRGYRWGGNDCCSALAAAHRQTLGYDVPQTIRDAAQDLAASPEIFP